MTKYQAKNPVILKTILMTFFEILRGAKFVSIADHSTPLESQLLLDY